MLHKNVAAGDVHIVCNWAVANAAARTGLSVVAGDVGKVCWQQDTDTFWFLKATTPTWVQIGASVVHSHVASDVTDFAESVDDRVAALLVQGSNITLTYNDAANTITIASTAAANITAKDEGTNLTTAMTSIDFTGAGVTASNTGGAVTVNIAGGGGATTLDGLTDVTAPTPATNDLLQYNGSAWVNAAQSVGSSTISAVLLNTANGYGSTNTKIRRFTNTVTNTGSDITYADSATLGASFTVNTTGVYAISYSENFGAAGSLGLSVNSAELTTNIESITVGNRLALGTAAASGYAECVSATVKLNAGDVIRPHTAGSATAAAAHTVFSIARVSAGASLPVGTGGMGSIISQNTTSGTNIDFYNIPSWAKRVTLSWSGMSTSGVDPVLIQLGTSGGVEATGYLGTGASVVTAGAAAALYTTGFGIRDAGVGGAAGVRHGVITFTLVGSNTWVASGTFGYSNEAIVNTTGGSKVLSGTLDRLRLTTTGGTNTFDAGVANILYEGESGGGSSSTAGVGFDAVFLTMGA